MEKKKLPLPGPAAWISAVVLFVFSSLVLSGVGLLMPAFLELWRAYPRLGALVGLLLALSPGIGLTIVHHGTKGALDRVERRPDPRGILPSVESVWAGLFGWCVFVLANVVGTFVLLVVFPPPPGEDSLAQILLAQTNPALVFSIRTIVFVVVSAFAYEAEGRTRVPE